MDTVEYVDELGRKYSAFQNGEQYIIKGPPEGLVDSLGLPEPLATNLHNTLYARGVLSLADAMRGANVVGALQEALQLDAQRITEAYFKFEKA